MEAEEIFNKLASDSMKEWDLSSFKKTHKTLYNTIIKSIDLALQSNESCNHIVESFVLRDRHWYAECKKCGELY